MITSSRFGKWTSVALMASAVLAAVPAWGAVTGSGDVSPANPATWTSATVGYVGNTSIGGVTVNSGNVLLSATGYVGYSAVSSGTVAVDGTGSKWTDSGILYVGEAGSGVLNVTNAGTVTNVSSYVGDSATGTGTVTLSDKSSLWKSSGTLFLGNYGTGLLSITNGAQGSVTSTAYLGNNIGSLGTLAVDGTGSKWTDSGVLYLGEAGSGVLNVTNGGTVTNTSSYLGDSATGTGTVTLTGKSSLWKSSGTLFLGNYGAGLLSIRNGAQASSTSIGYVGYNVGSLGTLTVDGTGSNWSNNAALYVGASGMGVLSVSNGGTVSSLGGNVGAMAGGVGTAIVSGPGSLWNAGYVYVGNFGLGSVTVANGGSIFGDAYLGYKVGSTGTATVDGAGSTWGASTAYVGYFGTGSLNVTNGGKVSNSPGYLGYSPGSKGTATVDGAGSTWINYSWLHVGFNGTGILSVTNGGQVRNSTGAIGFVPGGAGTVTVDGSGSTWTSDNFLYVSRGTLNITNGGIVAVAGTTYVGYAGSTTGWVNFGANGGTLTAQTLYAAPAQVSGTGTISTRGILTDGEVVFDATHGLKQTLVWNNGAQNVTINLDMTGASGAVGDMGAGYQGAGTLTIRDGVIVTSNYGYLGYASSASGTATVDGTGSTWTTSSLYVGANGKGTLSVTNGGTVTANGVSVNSSSLLAMNVGDASKLDTGTGTITNSGIIRLKGVPALASGSYAPIAAASWAGSGTVTALGGTWDNTAHTFIASTAASGTAGVGVTIDRSLQQRVAITDPTAGSVWAGFMPTASASSLTFSALPLTDGQKGPLITVLGAGGAVLAGWTFTADGYTAGDPVFLSLEIGAGHGGDNLAVWHFDGAAWSSYAASDLSYDGKYADFTVTGFSGYAVVAVPEPGAVALLGLGALGLLVRRRRRRDKVTG